MSCTVYSARGRAIKAFRCGYDGAVRSIIIVQFVLQFITANCLLRFICRIFDATIIRNYLLRSGVPKSLSFFLPKNQLYLHFIFVMFLGFVSRQGIRMLIADFVLLAQDHLIVLVNLMCPLETFPLKDFC